MTIHQPIVAAPGKYRLRAEDYLLLGEAGSFGDARTELIDGDVWIMSPAHSRHALAQSRLDFALRTALATITSPLEVYAAPSVRLSEDTMPEPDLVVASLRDEGELTASDVALVVEVADSSSDRDLGQKTQLYARAAIAEYWVVELDARVIHCFSAPDDRSYRERRQDTFGSPVTAATIPGLTVDTARL